MPKAKVVKTGTMKVIKPQKQKIKFHPNPCKISKAIITCTVKSCVDADRCTYVINK